MRTGADIAGHAARGHGQRALPAVKPMVFIVDDDPSVRKSLTRLLAAAKYAVEAFTSAQEFLAREPYAGPSCLVLDVQMPGLTGLALQEALAAVGRRMSIVFVSGHVKAMTGGAVDLLTTPVDDTDLLKAIQRAVAKDTKDLGREAGVAEIQGRAKLLTAREAEVFALVVTGMLNKQIAAALGIGEKTVKVHRAKVMEKMQAGSGAELVRLADRAALKVE